jgi:predicted hydrolase (HD superfamily)
MQPKQAEALLEEFVASVSLRRHCRGVAIALRGYARKLGQEEATWYVAGLLHDFDYERYPDQHPAFGIAHLEGLSVAPEILHAIACHARDTGTPFETDLDRFLFACDELSGFIAAVAFVRPSKSVFEVEPKSVLKKLATPAFAAGVNRDEVREGAELIGLPLEEHIGNVIAFLREDADRLGLRGTVSV